jgi:hypothetical protein
VAGLLDLLLGTNTGTGSQANQSGPNAATLQASSPWGNGTNFNTDTPANLLFTSGQQAQQSSPFMALLQQLSGGVPFKQFPKEDPAQQEGTYSAFAATPQWTPSPEQSQRLSQWESLLPSSGSGSIEDRRDVPELGRPPQLPAAMLGQGALQAALRSMWLSRLMPQQSGAWQPPQVTPNAPGPSMPMRFGGSGQ